MAEDAATDEFDFADAIAEEIDKKTVEIYIDIPDLEVKWKVPGIGSSELKNHCTVECSFNKESLEVDATVKKEELKKYKYLIKKLPGEIIPDDCKVKYKDGQITIVLKKKESSSWATALQRGLEQAR